MYAPYIGHIIISILFEYGNQVYNTYPGLLYGIY